MSDGDPLTFSDWLRRRRKALDLTQDQLAKLLHCSVDMIRKIEAGDRRPSRETADLLAKALAIPSTFQDRFVQIARMEPSLQQDEAIAAFGLLDSPSGHLPTSDAQRRMVAFLMCSLHEGAVLWDRHPHPMRAAYADYQARLRKHVSTFQGAEVTTLDTTTYTTFATIDDAIGAACAIQHMLQSTTWQEIGTLSVSLSIHIGSVDPSDPSVQAQALSLLTELCAIAHPGQILLSPAAQHLAAPELSDGYCIHDLGAYLLPSHTQREHIFQLDVPGGDAAFPPLRASGKPTHNLPTDLPPIIGRAQDVEEICALFRQPHMRLLTLTGIGGIGKTRLAYAVATALLSDFRYHVVFVSLAPLSDASFVLPTIAQVLGVTQSGNLKQDLMEHLAAQHMLLVLDNFEHVLDAAPLISELLRATPQLKVLVTSRARLNLYQEYAFAVQPLQIPLLSYVQESVSLEDAQQSSAVSLFVQRAQMGQPRFLLNESNSTDIVAICARLDGIPLAIELAAARISLLSPAVLLERLQNRFSILTNGAVDRPARQRTLRNTLDWSYNLLNPTEKLVFRRMGVFATGATIHAIAAVTQDLLDESDCFEVLASLQHNSFLEQINQDNTLFFTMLQTIRAYALDRLDVCGETEQTWLRCTKYYCNYLEQIEPDLTNTHQERSLNVLAKEYDNLQAILRWIVSEKNEYIDYAIQICSVLWSLWWIRGYIHEGKAWIRCILDKSSPRCSHSYANMIYGLGILERTQGDHAVALALFEQSLAIWKSIGFQVGIARALNSLGVQYFNWCDYEKAENYFNQYRDIIIKTNDVNRIAIAVNNLGNIEYQRKDYNAAKEKYKEALDILGVDAPKQTAALIMANLGEIARIQKDYDEAANQLCESIKLYRTIGNMEGVNFCLDNLIDLAIDKRQISLASEMLGYADYLHNHTRSVRTPEQQKDYERQSRKVKEELNSYNQDVYRKEQVSITAMYSDSEYMFDHIVLNMKQKGEDHGR